MAVWHDTLSMTVSPVARLNLSAVVAYREEYAAELAVANAPTAAWVKAGGAVAPPALYRLKK